MQEGVRTYNLYLLVSWDGVLYHLSTLMKKNWYASGKDAHLVEQQSALREDAGSNPIGDTFFLALKTVAERTKDKKNAK